MVITFKYKLQILYLPSIQLGGKKINIPEKRVKYCTLISLIHDSYLGISHCIIFIDVNHGISVGIDF